MRSRRKGGTRSGALLGGSDALPLLVCFSSPPPWKEGLG